MFPVTEHLPYFFSNTVNKKIEFFFIYVYIPLLILTVSKKKYGNYLFTTTDIPLAKSGEFTILVKFL
jgi:hypothetical protein